MNKQERSWVFYDWANSAYSIAITSTIFPIFFKGVLSKGVEGYTSTAWLGYGNSIYTLVIAVLAPILGTIADYKNYKKRFFLGFFLLGVVATACLALTREGGWISALVIYIFTALGFAGANIFYDSFLVDVAPRERMDWVSTSGFAWGYIGSTIPFILGIALIMKYDLLGFSTSVPAVKISFLVTALWWFVFTIPLLKNVKQTYFIEPSRTPVGDSFRRLADTFRRIRQYRNVFIFLIAYFLYIDGVDTIIKMATAFGTDMGISANMLMIILLAVQFVAFPFALLYGKLAKVFSAKRMLFVGILVYVVITITAFFIPYFKDPGTRIIIFWVLSMLVASSQGGIQALSRSFYGKLIPKEESAEFFGFYNIFGKFAAILGPFLMGLVTQVTKSSGVGILSLIVLFIAGGIVLTMAKENDS
ncbi:MAG TPA: MFS transporter [Spirochaetota bacterium]|nr:MFS transporter [Spirochaetota bacterium]